MWGVGKGAAVNASGPAASVTPDILNLANQACVKPCQVVSYLQQPFYTNIHSRKAQ